MTEIEDKETTMMVEEASTIGKDQIWVTKRRIGIKNSNKRTNQSKQVTNTEMAEMRKEITIGTEGAIRNNKRRVGRKLSILILKIRI